MSVINPNELNKYLHSLGAYAKKSLSQNFLIDANIINKIIQSAQISKGDIILEIGPGPGALTEALLEYDITVIAVEKDGIFAKNLARLNRKNNLIIYEEDFLKFSMDCVSKYNCVKVVANLPYHLSTPILQKLLPLNNIISRLVIMIQKEFADRIVAKCSTKEYGSFSVFSNYYSTPHYVCTISNNCFYPKPSVQSAIVTFDLKKPTVVASESGFFTLTRTAFGQRRKMIKSSLKGIYSPEKVIQALEKIHCNPFARPEELSLDNFIDLFNILQI